MYGGGGSPNQYATGPYSSNNGAVNSSAIGIRQRRPTTQSNLSGAKEDTFESSSFFDEGVPTSSNRYLFLF